MSTKRQERQQSNMAMNDTKIYQMMRYAMKHPEGVDIKDFFKPVQ